MFEVTNMPNYENFMKGIIMDVYLKDENKVISIEIQTTNHGDPPHMARYYQATPTSTPSRKAPAETKWYSSTTVFSADTSYTITSEDVSKLSFVDSTGAAYKAVLGSVTYNYSLEKDGSGSSITLKGTPNY